VEDLCHPQNWPQLIVDMHDTHARAERRGPGGAANRRGLQVVILEVAANPRYPDTENVPFTVLINPVLTPLSDELEKAGRLLVGFLACAVSGAAPTQICVIRFRRCGAGHRPQREWLPCPRGAA